LYYHIHDFQNNMPNKFLTGLLPAHVQSKTLRHGHEEERAHGRGEDVVDASQNQYGSASRPHGASDEYAQQQDSTAEQAAKRATETDNRAASKGELYEQRQGADKEDNVFTSGVDGVNHTSYAQEGEALTANRDPRVASNSMSGGDTGPQQLFHGHHTTRIGEELDPHLGQQNK